MNDNGKRIYLVIIWVITLAAIVFGIYRFVGGGFKNIFSFDNSSSTTKTVDLNNDVTDIDVDVSSANVLIEEGDAPSIAYTFPEKADVTLTQDNGKLHFKDNGGNYISFFGSGKKEIVITLPREKMLAKVNVTTHSGNAVTKNIHCDDVHINADSGNIIIEGGAIKNLDTDADSGNITLKGNVSNVTCKADSGNVVFNGNLPNITCKTDSGNIVINGDVDNIKAEADSGDITIDSNKSEQEMHLNLDADSGKIVVNGRKYR